jgi:hypothetical protein
LHDATLVSGDAAHFEPFDGLRVENWLAKAALKGVVRVVAGGKRARLVGRTGHE